MEVFRISHEKYATALTSSGVANRWNFDGQKVLYTGHSRSLSTLELTVHRNAISRMIPYKVMVISFPDFDDLVRQVQIKELPADWRSTSAYPPLRAIGSAWYKSGETLILKVPSAVIIQEYNYIINTEHPGFRDVQLVRNEDYFWDERLLETNP